MSIRDDIQAAMKEAMKNKNTARLECLRMAKGALLLKEKETGKGITDEQAVGALRAEVKKRQQTLEILREHGKSQEAAATEDEIRVLEEFLPRRLSEEELEAKVRAYVTEHPEIDHAGKLTGAMKKELGDAADGRMLNEVCRKVLG